MGNIIEKKYVVTMPDGSKWAVPVRLIAEDRAKHYADEFGGDVERSLKEDTIPLFEEDDYEIKDWASGNMDWSDVYSQAVMVKEPDKVDHQEGWVNGEYEVVDG